MLGPDAFRFLNVEGTVVDARGWNDPAQKRLWIYNLHYFDDLAADNAAGRAEWHHSLVRRWIDENPPGHGAGWEPYPTSLRIVNWIKWSLAQPHGPGQHVFDSLAMQTRWLNRHIEFHLLGNHLLANAKALVFAGIFFEGPEADGWLRAGLDILARELPEQILPDGGHFERSPMYHSIMLEDVLDLLNVSQMFCVAGKELAEPLAAMTPAMLRWLRIMTHPDGEIAFFNDAAFGIAPSLHDLMAYAQRLGVRASDEPLRAVEWLRESGYVRLQNARAVLLCDVALVGPDYLPGHAHADTLSFELSVDGKRVIVNTGTSTYEAGPERSRERSTMAHNTVEVDGVDSSEVWAAFRVARRARPFNVTVSDRGEELQLDAYHDGYRRLPGRVIHHRSWRLREGSLSVADALTGKFTSARVLLHAHPAITLELDANGNAAVLRGPDGTSLTLSAEPVVKCHVRPWMWSPEFGRTVTSSLVEVAMVADRMVTRLEW